ncbi:ARM repeat-containing protein [Dacryopinax primogenitus]|uniref:ARM repeat-containing protein n=1 Tax=Dacryopinax primogenitus (strain DJM 731) TaxID=1858805 RepID=M5G148_DACPD|nr:ARM repeat-containing protein [Dacryopinax primogenitus]EJU03966.1 ARM repeat-containing protein [Dacryopinax primogenitus]
MDYLRSIGSAAASAVLQKSGIAFPFSLGDKIGAFDGKTIWTLHDAVKRDDSSLVSVFIFDSNVGNRRSLMPLAKNALRKLRTIRHPDVLKFIDVVETDTTIHIVTERVTPLRVAAEQWTGKGKEREDWAVWGMHRVCVALAFINDAGGSAHGNVRTDSVFVSTTGEWKLGGFEVLSQPKDDQAVLYTVGGLVPDSGTYASPEVKKSGWSALKELDTSVADSYALGLLIHTTFNPQMPMPPTTIAPHPPPQPSSRGAIPTSIFPSFKRLLNPSAKHRMTVGAFLEVGMGGTTSEGSGFFSNNVLVKTCAGLENFALGSDADKQAMIRTLRDSANSFPPSFTAYKLLPSLLSALEFAGSTASAVLPLVFQFGKNVPPAEYQSQIVGPVVKLYASPDRGMRLALLEHLEEYADKLEQKQVVNQIWPNLQTGFTDTVAIIREATVRSIILIAPKLSDRILNNELLRQLAKTQMDPEASIRTNTVILIGRLAPQLSKVTKQKMLVPAFARSLKDAFVHARVAGLMAFMATADMFSPDEQAQRVLPVVCGSMVDKEKLVRDQAFKAVEMFVKLLESYATTLPDTVIRPESSASPNGIPNPSAVPATMQAQLVNSAAGAAGALAGWAMSSLSKQLSAADVKGSMGGSTLLLPAPPINGIALSPNGKPQVAQTLTGMPSAPQRPPPTPLTSASSSKGGMQLRSHTTSSDKMSALLAEVTDADEGDADGVNAWEGDLIDVNADADDWSAFEAAPVNRKDMDEDDGGWDQPAPEPAYRLSTVSSTANRTPGIQLSSTSRNAFTPPPARPPAPLAPKPVPVTSAAAPKFAPADTWGTFDDASSTPSRASTPVSAVVAAPSLAGMSKEEKAAELARRREERKQRIAQAKAQNAK